MSPYVMHTYSHSIEQLKDALRLKDGDLVRHTNSDGYYISRHALHSLLFWAHVKQQEKRCKAMRAVKLLLKLRRRK